MIARLRCVIAAAVVVILWLDPTPIQGSVSLAKASLATFCGYSTLMWMEAAQWIPLSRRVSAGSHWVDLGWFTVLIGLSGGTQSPFFIGYFFAILIASFRWGFRSGTRVTLAAAVLFAVMGYVARPRVPLELGRALLRPVYLLVLGYMISYWGGFHVSSSARLRLLRDVTALSNPRFGIDRTIGHVMRTLCTFYQANRCVLVTPVASGDSALVWGDDGKHGDRPELPTEIPIATLGPLLLLDPSESLAYTVPGNAHDALLADGPRSTLLHSIAESLSARSFMTVPWPQAGQGGGRLYLTSRHPHGFPASELGFLKQVLDQIMPTLENVRLVDRLATDAAEAERMRIARDLHDSVIQPYIGIRMGLMAIGRKLRDGLEVISDLDQLSGAISAEIEDLRRYLGELRTGSASRGALIQALSKFADRFSDATGIKVVLEVDENVRVNDRLAAETFQMVAEAVSNARRHTESPQVVVVIQSNAEMLTVRVTDEGTPGRLPRPFVPRSIADRTTALGGRVGVEHTLQGGSIVTIEIPM